MIEKIFSSPKMRNRRFVFAPKIQYEMTAERSEAASSGLPFSKVSARQDSNLKPSRSARSGSSSG